MAVERTDVDHRGCQQGGHDVAVRLAVDAPRRRAVVDQGDALLPPAALRSSRSRRPRCGRATSPHAGERAVRLEATPSYFYGSEAVASAMRDRLVNPHVLVVLREPVSRAISFFTYQKIRLRFPADYPIEEYLAAADRLAPDDFRDPDNERYMAFRGGCYADFLPALARRVRRPTGCTSSTSSSSSPTRPTRCGPLRVDLGLDPGRLPGRRARARRTAPPGSRARRSSASRSPATTGSSGCCAVIPRPSARCAPSTTDSTAVRRRSRSPTSVRAELAARYEEPNVRLARQLDDAGITKPAFLTAAARDQTS